LVMQVTSTDCWMTSYIRYLTYGLLPSNPIEAKIVKKNGSRYDGGRSSPLIWLLECMVLNERGGGEWFKEGFRKLLSQE